jgi:hypothetical protein
MKSRKKKNCEYVVYRRVIYGHENGLSTLIVKIYRIQIITTTKH